MEYNGEIRVNVKKLIERITKKKASEDRVSHAVSQLKDCIDYVTEHEVKLSIEGLHHKFIIHAEYEKSRKFQKLVECFIELTKPTGLTHSTWSILHLLFKLSYRPTERPDYLLEGQLFENIEVAADDFDWGKYLLDEELVQSTIPKTCDVWSDSEEDQSINETETIISKPLEVDEERLALFSSTSVTTIQFDLHQLIQENYWGKEVWSEYQLQREVLWALHSKDGTSALFQLNADGAICPKSVSIPSTPFHSLKNILSAFCPLLQGLNQLNAYIDDLSSVLTEQTYTLTHQAYADGLSIILGQFYKHLAVFEQRLVQQKITTTLVHLHSHINSWKLVIPSLAEIHCRITRIPASTSNHIRAACLLSELFNTSSEAQVTNYSSLYPVLLHLLYTSLEPILNIIDRWLTHGQIVDTYQEFGIKRNISVSLKSENFWHDSVLTRSDNYQLDFLQSVMNSDIMLAGRSVELLSHLGYLPSLISSSLQHGLYHTPSLIDIFRERFNDRFSSSSSTYIVPSKICVASSNLPSLSNEEFKSDNPLLNSAFNCLYQNLQRNVLQQNIPEIKSKDLHTPPEFFPLAPLLEYSLLEPIRCKQRLVSNTLLQVLYIKCNLRLHILTLRCIHLLQAGDLMDRFCLQLFQKMDLGDKWDSESMLTLSLINCLQSNRLSQSSAYISVNFTEHTGESTLSHLQINYAVPWPVNLIINQESLKLYNSIFRFLLSIKHALTSLQRLSFKSLSTLKNEIRDGANVKQAEQAELLPIAVRQHRLQLLRAWLIHFISSLDYYIMECVLENAHARLDSELKNATHLGEIADCHKKYINSVYGQCMQQPSAAFLRDTINEVLSTSIMVVSAWNNGISTKKLIYLEEKYVQHHQFVAAVLNTDAAHSMLPHVETLAAALIHSCPTELK